MTNQLSRNDLADENIVTVFGGTGFVGRRIVSRLLDKAIDVRAVSRHPRKLDNASDKRSSQQIKADILDPSSITSAIAGSRAVVNAVSLYVERGRETFERVHVEAAAALATAFEALLNDWDFGQWLVSVVEAAGQYLEMIVGEQGAAEGLTKMLGPVAAQTAYGYSDSEWRGILDDAMPDIYRVWPIARKLEETAGYAIYGVLLRDDIEPAGRVGYVEALVKEMTHFIEMSPLSLWEISAVDQDNQLTQIVRLAVNRLALDSGGSVDPATLAIFGGVTEGRIRNMMSGNDRKLANDGGKVPAADAMSWLKDRPEFFNSIWQEDAGSSEPPETISSSEDVLFVPVGRDGTPFHPGLSRNRNFTIGLKGSEVQISEFSEALRQLQRMPAPSWRRPNDVGNWGIIRAVEWKRFTAGELTGLATTYRLPTRDRIAE